MFEPRFLSMLSGIFHKLDEIGNNVNIGFRGFTTWNKIQWQNATPNENRTQAFHSLWFQVQQSPFYTNLICAAYEILKHYIRNIKSQFCKQMSS